MLGLNLELGLEKLGLGKLRLMLKVKLGLELGKLGLKFRLSMQQVQFHKNQVYLTRTLRHILVVLILHVNINVSKKLAFYEYHLFVG